MTVPIAFLTATEIGLFRAVGDLGYLPVATTGTQLRFVDTGYAAEFNGALARPRDRCLPR